MCQFDKYKSIKQTLQRQPINEDKCFIINKRKVEKKKRDPLTRVIIMHQQFQKRRVCASTTTAQC